MLSNRLAYYDNLGAIAPIILPRKLVHIILCTLCRFMRRNVFMFSLSIVDENGPQKMNTGETLFMTNILRIDLFRPRVHKRFVSDAFSNICRNNILMHIFCIILTYNFLNYSQKCLSFKMLCLVR